MKFDLNAILSGLDEKKADGLVRRGNISAMVQGRIISTAQRKLISQSNAGKKRSQSAITATANACRGKPRSQVTKDKIAATLRTKHPNSKMAIIEDVRRMLPLFPRYDDGRINFRLCDEMIPWSPSIFRACIREFFPDDRPTTKSGKKAPRSRKRT